MKRAGKVFLVLVLVMAMLWTSTGASNVFSVFAENSASIQTADEEITGKTENTEEKSTSTEKKEEKTEEPEAVSSTQEKQSENLEDGTTAEQKQQETTKKKEEDKETPSEATTETQKSSKQSTKQEDEITIQAGDTETPTVEEIPLDEYIKVEESGIYITIDGKQETLTSIRKNKKEIPTGAPV